MQRRRLVFLAVAFSLASVCAVVQRAGAESTGSMLGVISGVTSGYVDIKADRQIVRFALGDAFTGVFSGDGKTKRSLTDLTPGTNVRVAFVKPVLGEAYRKATEIDILRGPTKPLPLPKDSTP